MAAFLEQQKNDSQCNTLKDPTRKQTLKPVYYTNAVVDCSALFPTKLAESQLGQQDGCCHEKTYAQLRIDVQGK